MANLLADLYEEALQYNTINTYWSAIASAQDKVEGESAGQHPTIITLLKGVYHITPSFHDL